MKIAGNLGPDSPFHEGERAIQERVGVRERVEQMGRRMMRDFMPDQHRELFEQLPYLIVGSLDAGRRPWASIVTGEPGFVSSPDSRTLSVAAVPFAGDPLAENLRAGAPIGILGIELETRRRNRANGRVLSRNGSHFVVRVDQSFGNCPKYIQARVPARHVREAASPAGAVIETALLSPTAAECVRAADTFFIASASARAGVDAATSEGVDVSHRGGKSGFVRVTENAGATILTFPDFVGNFMFNTLGNIARNPKVGCLFVDFASGSLLSITLDAEIIWSGEELERFDGAERLVRMRVRHGVRIERALPFVWSEPEYHAQLAKTGAWPAS